jgi:hypothetical protein
MPLVTVDDYIEAKLTHSIHTSERKSFRGCRRRHDWLFREFFYPLTTAKPLEFGVAYHKGMETYYDPRLWGKPRDAVLEMAIQTFRQECQKQLDAFKRATLKEGDALPDDVVLDYKERKELGEGMLRYFHTNASQDKALHHLRPFKVEIAFEIPVDDGPEGQLWCKCKVCWNRFLTFLRTLSSEPGFVNEAGTLIRLNDYANKPELLNWNDIIWSRWKGLPVTYGGRIDAIFVDPEGKIWIFDWKTAAQLASENDRTEFLALDDQILSYCAALWKLGIEVRGFVYFEQKKTVPGEPEPLVRPRLGRMFSVSRQNPQWSAESYENTVKELDNGAYEFGLYDEYIDYLKKEGSRFHGVYKEYRTEAQMQECLEDIYLEAQDIIDPNLRIYRNAGRFNCGNCAFRQPCLEKSGGGDYMYALETMFEKRRYHYWEDKPPSTDSKGGE